MNRNIRYETPAIANYFQSNRIRWDQFYDSEKHIFEYISPNKDATTLDIGCGCGGLGLALNERFKIKNYTGIEINPQAAKEAKKNHPNSNIVEGDFLKPNSISNQKFKLVISLSCIDWNVEFHPMLNKAWSLVEPGGNMIISLRLTKDKGINDISSSFQYINYSGRKEGDIAPYIVLNHDDLIHDLRNFTNAKRIYGYGYQGSPSKTAETPYKKILFAVYAINKSLNDFEINNQILELNYKL